ncbi:hypothetical protein PIB30_049559 [Stylosanthes scabra]|uniref:Uncharacterized protein n=1 Tax=Stylosanthes scabra TaxID=79078 RepID=A0ABU6QHZ4_9FABA|nr:hypothetical protein [Stylosanthes scabra]
MAGRINSLVSSLPKFGHAGATIARASAWNPRIFAAATPRPIQVPPHSNNNQEKGTAATDGMKHETSEQVFNSMNDTSQQDKAYSTAEHMASRTMDKAGQVAGQMAQDISEKAKETLQETWDSTKNAASKAAANKASEKAKQTMQNAWDSTKNTADTVLEKAQDSADSFKQSAETLRRNIKKN